MIRMSVLVGGWSKSSLVDLLLPPRGRRLERVERHEDPEGIVHPLPMPEVDGSPCPFSGHVPSFP